jgi:RecB family exonuclease
MKDFYREPYLGQGADHIPISNSEIQTFKECQRKWYLQYYVGLGAIQDNRVGPLALGSRVHKSLEKFYAEETDPFEVYDSSVNEDRALFEESGDSFDEELDKKFWNEAELGRLMLEGYFEWIFENNLDQNIETIGIEDALHYSMLDDRIVLQGKIDRKVRDRENGHVSIIDYKTTQSFDDYMKTAFTSEQIRMYSLLERLLNDEEPIDGGLYRLLRKVKRGPKAKPPFYKQVEVRLTELDIQNYYRNVTVILKDMLRIRDELDSGKNHLDVVWKNFTRDCSWKCPFVHGCPLMDDGSDADRYFNFNFKQINPYERYVGEK